MIEFNFKGISIAAETTLTQHDYLICEKQVRSRHDKIVWLQVRFWEFIIDGNLQELAFVKSTLSYFMQAYWKRSSKEGCRVDLSKSLCHEKPDHTLHSLNFVARQKDRKNFLHIALVQNNATVKECYLDGQEVIMLDIAMAKAINLLTPKTIYQDTYNPLRY